MMECRKARVLVVEDDPAIHNGLLDVLVYHGYAPEGTADGGDGLQRALSGRFDLVLLDVMLPTMDGFSVCREIRRARPDLPVIMLTARGAENDIVTGFKAGADDYIGKPFSLRELMVRIEAVLRRSGKYAGDDRLEIGGIVFDGKTLAASCNGAAVELTRREMEIILYLHRNRSRIVTRRELLADVWQYRDPDVETRTVEIHIQKLRRKIAGLIGDIPFLHTIRGEGYRLERVS